jgi:DNA-binding NarL/FixJ family response regulator
MKVIVLDDHPALNLVIESAVRKMNQGAEIVVFLDLEPTLKYIKEELPNFVITDIQIHGVKQLEVAALCKELGIPCMVYTSHLNISIYKGCLQNNIQVFVSKSSLLADLDDGVKALIDGKEFLCSLTKKYLNRSDLENDVIPMVHFSFSELPVILGHIRGVSTIEIAKEMKKSKHTVRNQRTSLMHKNDCSMEEVARRYIYWYTEG